MIRKFEDTVLFEGKFRIGMKPVALMTVEDVGTTFHKR